MGQFSGQRKEGVLGFFTVIGWTATILGLVNARLISYQAGAYALLGMVIIVALSAILRSSLVRATLRVALPLAALAFLVIREGGATCRR
ncbi:MAG: hypothetical protein IPF98_22635 [Gemmatimonadetes bacterium]|nr:hypothetical protein [Gemmatimonadota bacterium]